MEVASRVVMLDIYSHCICFYVHFMLFSVAKRYNNI